MTNRTAISSGIAGIVLVLSLAGGAWGDDFVWTNNGGDRDWGSNANWDRFTGGCGGLISSGVSRPVVSGNWVVISVDGYPDCGFRPTVPAGQGPLVHTADGTNGCYGLILNNTLILEPDSYLRVRQRVAVGAGAEQAGEVTVKAGARFQATWDTSGSFRQCWIGDAGTGTLTIDGGWFGSRNVIRVGGGNTVGGGPGFVTITNGGTFFGRYMSFGAGGDATIQLTDGTIEAQEWVVIGGELAGAGLSTGTLTVDGGYVRACENSGGFYVGDDGTGIVTQNGGLIDIQDNDGAYPALVLASGAGSNGTVNLNGGMLYSKGFPNVNNAGLGASAVINFAGGKLGTRYWSNADPDNALYQTRDFISTGKFANGVSNDPDDPSWFYTQVPAGMSKYLHNQEPAAIWVISSPPAACDVYVGPAQTQNLTLRLNEAPVPIQYTVGNYGKTTTANYSVAKQPDEAWVSLDKTGGSVSPNGGTDTVTATINASGLTPGNNYTMDLVFTHDCDPSVQEVRTITLYVPRWSVNPPEPPVIAPHTEIVDASIVAYLNCLTPQTYTYTITNLAPTPLSYTVAETDQSGNAQDHTWLELDKLGGGPLNQGESDTITVTLTGTGDGPEARNDDDTCVDCVQNGWMKFTATGFGDMEIRQIQMTERWIGALFGFVRAYLGDVPPYDAGWFPGDQGSCGPGCQFNIIGTETGEVVQDTSDPDPDYNAQNGYALKIDQGTEASPGPHPVGRHGYASDINMGDAGGNNNAIHGRLGTTMLARVKVVRDFQMGANLWIRDDNTGSGGSGDMQSFGTGCRVRWNSNNHIYEFVNTEGPHPAGNGKADAYHLIRIVDGWGPYGEHVVKIWVDEDEFPEPALEVHGALAEGESAYDAFCFGTFGTNSHSELYYDWVSFTDAGMYGPGEEDSCIGSLLPGACCLPNSTCAFTTAQACEAQGGSLFLPGQSCAEAAGVCGPDPYADFDEDGDVDVADFAEFQRCMVDVGSGLEMRPGCARWDRNGDGFVDNTIVNSVSDLGAFLACSSGPDVPADVCCDGGVGCP